jgi:hypothetical protein
MTTSPSPVHARLLRMGARAQARSTCRSRVGLRLQMAQGLGGSEGWNGSLSLGAPPPPRGPPPPAPPPPRPPPPPHALKMALRKWREREEERERVGDKGVLRCSDLGLVGRDWWVNGQ